ncbi:MAG: hypothetical protein CMF62_01650 [Magnetococcales bacterium]|nr:hypothetical protein [Magnetococcales bacterium]|tara:strand:+ start:62095 stop:62364 length:270 start_codon:yes stop_codon:yes gene_type:complete
MGFFNPNADKSKMSYRERIAYEKEEYHYKKNKALGEIIQKTFPKIKLFDEPEDDSYYYSTSSFNSTTSTTYISSASNGVGGLRTGVSMQ